MSNVREKVKFRKIFFLVLGTLGELITHRALAGDGVLLKNYGFSLSFQCCNMLFLNIIFVLFLGWIFWKRKEVGLVLILIGGLVNLIDRIEYGYVRDYWILGEVLINNLNDWLIVLGVLLFLIESLWKKQK